jgi:hypothetical protein
MARYQEVFEKLSVVLNAHFDQRSAQEAIALLKNERNKARWIFINTKDRGEFHLVRVSEVKDDKVVVINPSVGVFELASVRIVLVMLANRKRTDAMLLVTRAGESRRPQRRPRKISTAAPIFIVVGEDRRNQTVSG